MQTTNGNPSRKIIIVERNKDTEEDHHKEVCMVSDTLAPDEDNPCEDEEQQPNA